MVDESGRPAECSLVASVGSRPCTIEFKSEGLGPIAFSTPDLFGCLCELRQWLAVRGYRVPCNGARSVDTWASSMSRQMGGARKIYLTRMGHPATFADLVPIFGERPSTA